MDQLSGNLADALKALAAANNDRAGSSGGSKKRAKRPGDKKPASACSDVSSAPHSHDSLPQLSGSAATAELVFLDGLYDQLSSSRVAAERHTQTQSHDCSEPQLANGAVCDQPDLGPPATVPDRQQTGDVSCSSTPAGVDVEEVGLTDAVDDIEDGNPWQIKAGKWRHGEGSRATAPASPGLLATVFIGGLAEDTSEEALETALKAKGVTMRKCHALASSEKHPGCVAFKAYVLESDVSRITTLGFWPKGIWCRLWRRPQQASN